MKKEVILILFLMGLYSPAFPNWYFIGGQYSSEWRLELTTEIASSQKNLFVIFDFFEPKNYSNGFSSQQIALISWDFKGDMFTEPKIFDPENQLKRFIISLKNGTFFMHKSYRFKSDLNLTEFFVDSHYPVKHYNESMAFLLKSELPDDFKEKLKTIAKDRVRITDVIFLVSNWIKNDFNFSLSSKRMNFWEMDNIKLINQDGVIELWIAALRYLGIPCRVIHGYSFPATFSIDNGDEHINFVYPRGNYNWIEFYAEGLGWLPIDPWTNTYFFTQQNLLRKTAVAALKSKQERVFIYPRKPVDFVFNYNIFSEKDSKDKKFKIENISDCSDYFLTPPVNSTEKPQKQRSYPLRFLPDSLDLYSNFLKIDVEISTGKEMTQKINFSKPRPINSITLPLYFIEMSRLGELWLEIKNGSKTYRSEIKKTGMNKLEMKYKMVQFKMPQPIQLSGDLFITLKIKNLAAVFWYGIIGNPIGDKNDTFLGKNNFFHLDLCYDIK